MSKSTVFDFMELTAVFLLAVEAIKIENLVYLKAHWKKAYRFVNPKIEYVDELPSEQTFLERNSINIYMLFIYFVGLGIILFLSTKSSVVLPRFNGFGSLLYLVPYYIFAPAFVGGIAYSLIAYIMVRITDVFEWIENNSASGVVGIVGFILFFLQFIGRRTL